ncbi:hypothetical protein T484DRAFT_1781704, partial [Baffinella frigidus]
MSRLHVALLLQIGLVAPKANPRVTGEMLACTQTAVSALVVRASTPGGQGAWRSWLGKWARGKSKEKETIRLSIHEEEERHRDCVRLSGSAWIKNESFRLKGFSLSRD